MALFKSSDGTQTFSTVKTPTYKYKKGNQFKTFYSKTPGAPKSEANIAAMLEKSEASYKVYEDKFGKALLDRIALKMHGKKFRELDKESTLKNFKAKLDKYEDFIIKNKRYPSQAEAFQIGMQRAGRKKVGLGKSGITGNIKKFIDDTYSKGIGGSTYIAKELAKPPYNYKIDASNVRRYITEEVEAGRLKRPKKFKTQEADPTLPKDRYFKVRPTTPRDVTQYGAPTWAKFKVSYKTPRNPDNTLIPKKYFGTQYYRTKESAEKALEARRKLDLSRTDEAVRVVNKLIKADPDLATDIRTLAQEVYGAAEGATDLAKEQDLERKMRSVATDVTRLQEQLAGKLQGFDTKNISKLVLPTGTLAENILTDITVNTDIGRFGGTEIRNSRMRIISGILNERAGKFKSLRNQVTKFVASGRHLDEVAGIGATYDVAPGYSSFAQSIPDKVNLAKRSAIDLDFARLLRQAVLNEEGPKSFQKVKYNTLGEAIDAYNKFSREFAKENKIFTPTIEYSPGKKLDPSKFAPNFTALRPEAKANVLELAERGIGIGVGKAMPFEKILSAVQKAPKGACRQILNFQTGGISPTCAEAIKKDPVGSAEKLSKLDAQSGPLAKVKNAALGFLRNPGIRGFGAAAIAGAAGAGLVKEFRNDDPTTYLSNEDQQKSMLVEMATDPVTINFDRPAILDYQLPALGAEAAAGIAVTAPSTIKASKSRALGIEKKRVAPGTIKTGARVLGRGLASLGTPLGLLPMEAANITSQIAEGDSPLDIATDPLNYLGATFAEPATKIAARGVNPKIASAMRLGMSPTALRLLSRAGGIGLGASLGIMGLQKLSDL